MQAVLVRRGRARIGIRLVFANGVPCRRDSPARLARRTRSVHGPYRRGGMEQIGGGGPEQRAGRARDCRWQRVSRLTSHPGNALSPHVGALLMNFGFEDIVPAEECNHV